jgi:ELWxxDGT repeat protein
VWLNDGGQLQSHGEYYVKDINTAPSRIVRSSYQSQAVALGDDFFFAADDGVIGNELWRSDGTAEGTHPLLDLNPGPAAAAIRQLIDGRPGGLFARVPPLVGGASGAVVGVPVEVGNGAASDIAGTPTISVTLGAR